MDTSQIAGLLQAFVQTSLETSQIENISSYLDLLLLWNARINLTGIREPDEIIPRHFGESLFAARRLFPEPLTNSEHLIDIGSGAGFPGLPIKIWARDLKVTLIESNQKKATFLREVVRKLGLADVEVFSDRAEAHARQADVVTLRAVERFEQALPVALRLVQPGGRLALLIGEGQVERGRRLGPSLTWNDAMEVPLSSNRVLLIGRLPDDRENQRRHESTL
jgi:16S rRNA (guanine527-N7)-methyltransferase